MAELVAEQTAKETVRNLGNHAIQTWWAQAWTASESFDCDQVNVTLYRNGTITGETCWIEIWDDSGGSPNAVIANGTSDTVDPSTITTNSSGEVVAFTFSTPPSLTSSSVYYFMATQSFGVDAANFLKILATTTTPAGWPLSAWRTNGEQAGDDLWIQVYKSAAAGGGGNLMLLGVG